MKHPGICGLLMAGAAAGNYFPALAVPSSEFASSLVGATSRACSVPSRFPVLQAVESQNGRGWKGPLWVI